MTDDLFHRMPDGTEYRVILKSDPDAQKPEDDGQWPILQVSYRHYDYVAEAYNDAAQPYVAKFNELFERIRELRVWGRYVKIFHGASNVHEWGFNRGTDYAYIAFDPTVWRKAMGFEDGSAAEELAALEQLAGEDPLSEIKAWIEGDVYGIVSEKRWNPDENLGEEDDWEEVESCWGYYGHKWATQAAKEELEACASQHKYVHRYPEHEKITPHQREIDTILEFLEAPGKGAYGEYELCEDSSDGYYHAVPSGNHQRVVFEHFGIDYKKIEEERELMFRRLQMEASIEAGLAIKKAQEANDK